MLPIRYLIGNARWPRWAKLDRRAGRRCHVPQPRPRVAWLRVGYVGRVEPRDVTSSQRFRRTRTACGLQRGAHDLSECADDLLLQRLSTKSSIRARSGLPQIGTPCRNTPRLGRLDQMAYGWCFFCCCCLLLVVCLLSVLLFVVCCLLAWCCVLFHYVLSLSVSLCYVCLFRFFFIGHRIQRKEASKLRGPMAC